MVGLSTRQDHIAGAYKLCPFETTLRTTFTLTLRPSIYLVEEVEERLTVVAGFSQTLSLASLDTEGRSCCEVQKCPLARERFVRDLRNDSSSFAEVREGQRICPSNREQQQQQTAPAFDAAFFERGLTMAKPTCMKNTRTADTMIQTTSRSLAMADAVESSLSLASSSATRRSNSSAASELDIYLPMILDKPREAI